jgi:hypothetical protein
MDVRSALEARRNPDGGFGPVAGAPSEAEATAMVALAMDDPDAARWVEGARSEGGGVGFTAGSVFRDVTAVAVLAMRDAVAVRGAVHWLATTQARSEPAAAAVPHDPTLRGWSWTTDTFGWVEPTAWAVLALRSVGEEETAVGDGIAVLRDRECATGGWNYGNRVVLGEELSPYVQTTGLALLALWGVDDPMVGRGAAWLEASWSSEADGLLSLSVATSALRRHRSAEAEPALDALRTATADAALADTVTLAWAVIGLTAEPAFLEVP